MSEVGSAARVRSALPCHTGIDAGGNPHIYYTEGFVAFPPRFLPARRYKKACLSVALRVPVAPEQMFHDAYRDWIYESHLEDPKIEGAGILEVAFFGAQAEELQSRIRAGSRMAVAGILEQRRYIGRDGRRVCKVALSLEHMILFSEDGEGGRAVLSTQVLRSGEAPGGEHQAIAELVTGTVRQVSGLMLDTDGNPQIRFRLSGVPVRKFTEILCGKEAGPVDSDLQVLVRGPQAAALARKLRSGSRVCLSGPLTVEETGGELRCLVSPFHCSLLPARRTAVLDGKPA